MKLERDSTIRQAPTSDHNYVTSVHQHEHDESDAVLITHHDIGTQTDLTMQEITKTELEHRHLSAKLDAKETLFKELFVQNITKNDENVRMYTGIQSLTLLLGIFNILMSKCNVLKYWSGQDSAEEKLYQNNNRKKPGPARKLSPFHEFVLTLIRLRLGLHEFFLADIYGVSKSRVSQIFTTWINFMSSVFGKVIKWPSRSQVKRYMPKSFKCSYPNTRTIIDCTEFFFQKPRSPTAQAATYSTYKSKNTGKCLLGISPAGTFTFVSDIYGGNVSDRYITQHSGFLDLIEEGDDVMADRGFTIRDLLTDKRATLNMPPFTRKCAYGKNKRLNVKEIQQTRTIAKLRIHVERAIQRLKLFRLIGNTIPWSLKPLMNQMVKVSAFLCNLMPTLVKR